MPSRKAFRVSAGHRGKAYAKATTSASAPTARSGGRLIMMAGSPGVECDRPGSEGRRAGVGSALTSLSSRTCGPG